MAVPHTSPHRSPPPPANASARPPALPWLAAAGLAGPTLFAVSALLHSLARSDHVLARDPISALAAGPTGWVQNANFVLFGVLLACFAVGLHRGLRPTRRGLIGPFLVGLSGVGLLWAALFPATDATGAYVDDRVLHLVAFLITFLSAIAGLLVISVRMRRDPAWERIAPYARATGAAMLTLFVAGGILVRPVEAPFHAWIGAFQWLLLATWFPCLTALALRLHRVTRVMAPGRDASRVAAPGT